MKKKIINHIILSLFVLLYISSAISQPVQIEAKTDSSTYLIGDWIHIKLKAAYQSGNKVKWPQVPDSLGKLEVIRYTPVDSVKKKDSIIRRQEIIATAYDSGRYIIPPFSFEISYDGQKDTLVTKPIPVFMQAIPVDTTQEIKPIKPPIEIPLTFKDILPWILVALAAILLLTSVIWFWKKRSKELPPEPEPSPVRPAHIIAHERLDKLEREKLWEKEQVKYHYSLLSEIIREYLENRYGIRAMESTTDEIILQVNKVREIQGAHKEELRTILQLSDLVKFAKWKPAEHEPELNLKQVKSFVDKTKKLSEPEMK